MFNLNYLYYENENLNAHLHSLFGESFSAARVSRGSAIETGGKKNSWGPPAGSEKLNLIKAVYEGSLRGPQTPQKFPLGSSSNKPENLTLTVWVSVSANIPSIILNLGEILFWSPSTSPETFNSHRPCKYLPPSPLVPCSGPHPRESFSSEEECEFGGTQGAIDSRGPGNELNLFETSSITIMLSANLSYGSRGWSFEEKLSQVDCNRAREWGDISTKTEFLGRT